MLDEIRWNFNKYTNSEPMVQTNTSEAFNNTDSDLNDLINVVREATQNSIDARDESISTSPQPVIISFTLDSLSLANTNSSFAKNCFSKDLTDRIQGSKNYKNGEIESIFANKFDYLLIEDMNTTGLEGSDQPKARKGSFFGFVWAEGVSVKSSSKNLGAWGMGKVTFLKNSAYRLMFVLSTYTELESSKNIERMAGIADIGNHDYELQTWKGAGRFVTIDQENNASAVYDDTLISDFRKLFKFKREPGSNGLSVLVPFIDKSIITVENLVATILKEYAPAIAMGNIEYLIYSNNQNPIKIDKNNLIEILKEYQSRVDFSAISDMLSVIYKKSMNSNIIYIDGSNSGSSILFNDVVRSKISEIESYLSTGESVILNCKIPIIYTSSMPNEVGEFYIGLINSKNSRKPVLLRSGLKISSAIDTSNRHIFSILMISEGPMATLVRNAENPSHTKLSHNEDKFKDSGYKNGKEILTILKTISLFIENELFSENVSLESSQINKYFTFSGIGETPTTPTSPFTGSKSKHSISITKKECKSVMFTVSNLQKRSSKSKKASLDITILYEKNRNGGVSTWNRSVDGILSFPNKSESPLLYSASYDQIQITNDNSIRLNLDFEEAIDFYILSLDTKRSIVVETKDLT